MNDWNFYNLESLIQSRGDEIIHETGVSCTCRAEDVYGSGILKENRLATRRRLGCNKCGGTGWIYRDASIIKGLVTGVETGRNRQLLEMGYAVPGDCTFSPSLHAKTVSDFDRVTFLYPAPVSDGQIVMRNAARLSDNSMLDLGLSDEQDRLWYQADCVLHLEDEDGRVYQQDTDYSIDGKTLTWIGARPEDGKFYTVKYTAYFEWICYATPMTRFDRARKLGQKVLLRKYHVAAQNDYKFDTAENRNEQEIAFTTKTTI